MKVNLTLVFITVSIVAMVGFAGAVILTISDKDATAFYGFLSSTLITVVGFGGTLFGLNKLSTKTDEIKTNVNGNLSKLIDLATNKATTRAEHTEIREVTERTGVTGSTPADIA